MRPPAAPTRWLPNGASAIRQCVGERGRTCGSQNYRSRGCGAKGPTWSHTSHLDIDDALILGSGRPVFVVPNDGLVSAAARRVLVAWSGTRRQRAPFDALPILQQAEEVRVVTISADEPDASSEERDLDICTALVRHDVKCRATEHITTHDDVGRSLTEQAIAQKADLLVMGCYGHSRLREFVLGGASRYHPSAHDHPRSYVPLIGTRCAFKF